MCNNKKKYYGVLTHKQNPYEIYDDYVEYEPQLFETKEDAQRRIEELLLEELTTLHDPKITDPEQTHYYVKNNQLRRGYIANFDTINEFEMCECVVSEYTIGEFYV